MLANVSKCPVATTLFTIVVLVWYLLLKHRKDNTYHSFTRVALDKSICYVNVTVILLHTVFKAQH